MKTTINIALAVWVSAATVFGIIALNSKNTPSFNDVYSKGIKACNNAMVFEYDSNYVIKSVYIDLDKLDSLRRIDSINFFKN